MAKDKRDKIMKFHIKLPPKDSGPPYPYFENEIIMDDLTLIYLCDENGKRLVKVSRIGTDFHVYMPGGRIVYRVKESDWDEERPSAIGITILAGKSHHEHDFELRFGHQPKKPKK